MEYGGTLVAGQREIRPPDRCSPHLTRIVCFCRAQISSSWLGAGRTGTVAAHRELETSFRWGQLVPQVWLMTDVYKLF